MAYVLKRYNGTSWVPAVKRYWDGSKWAGVDGAGDVAGPFDPLSITWHAAYWAEDSNWTPPAVGSAVSQWDDASGNGRHVTQGTASLQPVYRDAVSALNSKPAVEFGGDGDNLRTTWTEIAAPVTIVVVGRLSGSLSKGHYFVDGPSSSFRTLVEAKSSQWGIYNGSTELFAGSTDTNGHLFIATFASTDTVELDGTEIISGNAGSHNNAGVSIGADPSASTTTSLLGHVAFVGVYHGTLTQQEKDDLLAWSQSHYGTP